MKRILLLLPLVVLLGGWGWQSKKEICALWTINALTDAEALQKLGIRRTAENRNWSDLQLVEPYCSYFRN